MKLPRVIPLLAVLTVALFPLFSRAAQPRLFPDISLRFPVGDPVAENPISDTEGPKTLAAGDFNGDGLADVVVGNLDGSVSVLLGLTTNSFSAQILVPATGLLSNSSLRAVVVGDFNKDGKLDVVAGDIAREGVIVLTGAGNGTLQPVARIPLGPVRAMAAADFDADGNLDLLVACSPPDCNWCSAATNSSSRFLCVLPGNGNGTFGAPRYLLTPGTEACFYDVEAADMNNDGSVDVLSLDFVLCSSTNGVVNRSRRVQIFANNGQGGFATNAPTRVLEAAGEGPRALHVGYIDEQVVGGTNPPGARLDIVVVNRDSSSVDVFLNQGAFNFSAPLSRGVGGGPRDVAIHDVDGDGFADLIVVERYGNEVSILPGLGSGLFGSTSTQLPTGVSPRNIAVADFNGDGIADIAVNNRVSGDISLFVGSTNGGFFLPGNYYSAGVSPVSLVAEDFNGDGFPDVATVSIRSHDVRVRLNTGSGAFGNEQVYPVNYEPVFIAAGDLNGDGKMDLAVTCLGSTNGAATASGTLVTLLGRGDGTFQTPVTTVFDGVVTRPYWLRLGDLDGDGKLDAAVGGTFGELAAFRGRGDGTFDSGARIGPAPSGRPLGIALGDFDGDGRLDIATSRGIIFLNDGQFFTNASTNGVWVGRSSTFDSGTQAWAVEAADLDGDGRLDLLLALTFVRPDPIGVFFGNGDGTLTSPTIYSGPDVGVVAMAAVDVDGDGNKDIIVGNRCAATVIVLRGVGHRQFEYREIISAYSVEDVAVADLNGDSKPDIVGVGGGLWAALNGGTNGLVQAPDWVQSSAPDRIGVYINEIMALNTSYHITNSSTPDWIELYNNNNVSRNLSGWSLAQYTADGTTNRWYFPSTVSMTPFSHLVIYCKTKPGTNIGLYATFQLSADGENVALLRPDGGVEDFVTFPALAADVSYARISDGSRFFAYNPSPSLGAKNEPPANLQPTAERKQPYVAPGATGIGVNARFFDDVAIAYASVCYRVAGSSNGFDEITLSDDGLHGDKAAADGYYGALLPSFPPGASIEYYLRVIDIEGQSDTSPGKISDPTQLHHLTVPAPLPALRLTELVAANNSGLRDERGQYEDWIEVYNSGATPINLSGYALSLDALVRAAAWNFPNEVIQPGQRIVVFCDESPTQGVFHATFKLLKGGDRVFLIDTSTWTIVDSLSFGPMPTDASFGVLGTGTAAQLLAWPTPGAENAPIPLRRTTDATRPDVFWRIARSGSASTVELRWLTRSNQTYAVEYSDTLTNWSAALTAPVHLGEGLYQWTTPAAVPKAFYRVLKQ